MNKKRVKTFFSILILLILFLPYMSAQSIESLQDDAEQAKETAEKVVDTADKLIGKDSRSELINDTRDKILTETAAGQQFTSFTEKLEKINPFFNFLFGLEFSWSQQFILTVIIWVTLIIFLYRILSIIAVYSSPTHWIIAIVSATIISAFRIPKYITILVTDTIQGLSPNIFIKWALNLLFIILLLWLGIFSKLFHEFANSLKNKREKQTQQNQLAAIAQSVQQKVQSVSTSQPQQKAQSKPKRTRKK